MLSLTTARKGSPILPPTWPTNFLVYAGDSGELPDTFTILTNEPTQEQFVQVREIFSSFSSPKSVGHFQEKYHSFSFVS